MGQSCGGVAANFGSDPRVKTIGLWNAATSRNDTLGSTMNKPVLIVTGDGRYDVAFYEGLAAFEAIKRVPVFFAWRVNMSHMGTFRQTNGGELAPIATAWLDWPAERRQDCSEDVHRPRLWSLHKQTLRTCKERISIERHGRLRTHTGNNCCEHRPQAEAFLGNKFKRR